MAGLGFVHPALLWGLTLGAVPILLHLLQRRRYRVRRWAAMEFLRASVRRSSRRLRIEQWLLLMLRALILILAALALARPVWHAPRWGWFGSRAAAQVVLVLDDSYSMGWRGEGGANAPSQFERARARALELIHRGLMPGDAVSVVLASEPARALIRRPTFNLAEVAAQVQRLAVSDRRSDLPGAARRSLEILRSSQSATREVYLLTNGQAAAWRRPGVAEAWQKVAAAGRLHLVPTPPARGPNLSVDEVRVDGPVAPGRAAPVQARLVNHSDRPAQGVVATLHADGRAVTSARTDIPAGGTVEVRFDHAFTTPGSHPVMVSLPPDGLAVDDRGYATAVGRDRVRVLILNGHPDPDPRQDAAFFVAAALDPDGASGARFLVPGDRAPGAENPAPFAARVLDGSSFRGEDLSRQDVVVLADVPRLSSAERQALAHFASDGGGVLILPGPSAARAFYNGDMQHDPPLMPARLGRVQEAGPAAPALDLTRVDHPALARFRGAADVDLTTARFGRYYQLVTPDASTGARVLCRYTSGSPALVERAVGLGRVALMASPILPGWSTLPFKPAFVPFLHSLVAYLGQGPGSERNVRVGEPLVTSIPAAGEAESGSRSSPNVAVPAYVLEQPDGRRVTLRPSGGQGGVSVVRLEAASRAGLYHLTSPSNGSPRGGGPQTPFQSAIRNPKSEIEAWFAVNLRTDDSDLRVMPRPELERRLHPAAIRWVSLDESLAAVVREGRHGREAWRSLLLAALVLMLCESGMAQRFGRRRD